MKQRFILAVLLLMVAGLQRAWALDAYAVMKDGKVTFYYDNLKNSRDGVLEIHDTYGTPYPYKAATTAVFDASFANYRPTSTAYWFQNCSLTSVSGLENLRTDNVTDMQYMFGSCGELTSLDLSGFNTENVTNMCNMFQMCWNLKSLDLSGFKTSKVTDMSWMFQGCVLLPSLDLSSFNTKSVTNMNKMFSNCQSLPSLDLSGFNTENVTDMGEMFNGCRSLSALDLSSFNTAKVTNVSYMFGNCSALTTIYVSEARWNMESVTQGSSMFWNCTSLVGGNGTTYDEEHIGYEYACVDTPEHPGYLTIGIEAYAVLSEDRKTVTFYYDNQRAQRSGAVEINSGSNLAYYRNATTVVFDESFADYRPTSTAHWFYKCRVTSFVGMENLHTEEVTDMQYMFFMCENLAALNLSNFNTAKVTNMKAMFWSDGRLSTLDVSSFNTANVTNMSEMFSACLALTVLDLSSFNTANVTSMYNMFNTCKSLQTIYVDEQLWSMEKVTDFNGMFGSCTNLVGGNGTTYDMYHINREYACVDTPEHPGYLTAITKYNLWIAGKQVTITNSKDVLGDGTINYDFATKTLHLSDATIQGSGSATGDVSERGTGIYIEESDVTIDVQGICTVTGDTECNALWFGSGCRRSGIAGDGTLRLVSDYIALFDNSTGDTLTIGGNVMVEADGGIVGLQRYRRAGVSWYNTLRITDFATVKAMRSISPGIESWKELLLENEHEVTAPEGAYWDAEQHEPLHADGSRITGGEWVVIDNEEYITGVSPLLASPEEEGQSYNMAGQKVGEGYKGIVIKDGKKVLVK